MNARFDFLRDAPPEIVDRMRGLRVSARARFPLAVFVAASLVVFAWWGLERHWLHAALREDAIASERLSGLRLEFQRERVERVDVDRMLALDERLRAIRRSGSRLSSRLAAIANRVPERAWLVAIQQDDRETQLDGRAEGLLVLSRTLAALLDGPAPSLIRAARDERGKGTLMSFSLRLHDKTP